MPSVALAVLRDAVPKPAPQNIPGDAEMAAMIAERRREFWLSTAKMVIDEISLDEWGEIGNAVLLEGHTNAAWFGRLLGLQLEGEAILDDVLIGQAASDLESYYYGGFLQNLRDKDPRYWDEELAAWKDAAIKARQDSYLGRMRGTANMSFLRYSGRQDFYWRLGAPEEHCAECPEYAAMSPMPADEWPTAPGENDTPCLFNCGCFFEREDGVTGFSAIGL